MGRASRGSIRKVLCEGVACGFCHRAKSPLLYKLATDSASEKRTPPENCPCGCMDLHGCYREQPSKIWLFLGDLDITACFCFVGLVGGNGFLHLYYFSWRKTLVELLTCHFVKKGRKDEALLPVLFWTKHFKANERSHPVQVKPNAPFHCYPLAFIHAISVLLNSCVIIWKYLDCCYEKQGTTATSSSGLHSQSKNQNNPLAHSLSLDPEAWGSHRFQFPVSNRLKLSEAKWRWQPKTHAESVRYSQ